MRDWRPCAILILLATLLLPQIVHAQGDPSRGAQLSGQCEECHGDAGENRIEGFPNLANQNYNYLVKQLREIRTSARERYGEATRQQSAEAKALLRAKRSNEIMDPFVVELSDEDIHDLSAYYADQACNAVMVGAPLPAPKIEARCQVCHGKFGITKNSNIPNIAGQDALYLEQQLLNFKTATEMAGGAGNRRAGIMESQVRMLSDQDIKDISLYYARLPCR
ncbi:MAG: c-type cytochrome [Rhodospirillales bacterium]|nr:c-type cytochrome [Rhodospirillales bacterium]